MPKTFEEVLAGIQDPESQSVLKDAQAKATRLAELEAKLADAEIVPKKTISGWNDFDKKWKDGLDKKVENINKIEAERDSLKAEIAKLRPEADRAAILAAQIDKGEAVDPAKILEMGKGKFVSVDQVDEIVKRAVGEAKKAVDYGSLPSLAKLNDYQNKAYREFGLDIDSATMGEAISRHGGFDQAYAVLTAEKRAAKEAADRVANEAKYKTDLEAAERKGFEKARTEFETRTYVGEEGGMSGVIPMIPSKPEDAGVNPQTYDPNRGELAKQYAEKARSYTQQVQ